LEVATGKVTHRLSDTHAAVDFLAFLNKVIRAYPSQELHVILDNSSSRGTAEIMAWLAEHPRVRFQRSQFHCERGPFFHKSRPPRGSGRCGAPRHPS
jgi:hypothetical protein